MTTLPSWVSFPPIIPLVYMIVTGHNQHSQMASTPYIPLLLSLTDSYVKHWWRLNFSPGILPVQMCQMEQANLNAS